MLSCGLLILIIVISFFLSKRKKENLQRSNEFKNPDYTGVSKPVIYLSATKRTKDYSSAPKIFPIDNSKPREVNIIFKQTMTKSSKLKTNSKNNRQRYTIVNDELYKKNNRAANYYL
jgi:hypothetical protein